MDPVILTFIIIFLGGIILGMILGVKVSHSGQQHRSERMYRM